MERASILVGKCYRDDRDAVYEVTSYDGKNVRFVVRARSDEGATIGQERAEPWSIFLQRLQGEVACPPA